MAVKSNIERYDAKKHGRKGCDDGEQKDAEFVLTDNDGNKHYFCEQDALKYFINKAPVKMRSELLFKLVMPK
jgi:hypothetical protein